MFGQFVGPAFALRDPTLVTGWMAYYFIQAGLGIAVLLFIRFKVPPPPSSSLARKLKRLEVDWLGILLGIGFIVPLLVAATEGGELGWSSPLMIGLWICSGVCSVGFAVLGYFGPPLILGVSARPIVPVSTLTDIPCGAFVRYIANPSIHHF